MKTRESNIELLRIICMLLLIAHHCAVHGGLLVKDVSANKAVAYLFVPIGKIAFDTFLAISTWFMVNTIFKAERFWKIWFQVLFYNLLLVMLGLVLNMDASIGVRQFVGSFFPIVGNSHGFASSYLVFLLLIPFLRIIIERCDKRGIVFLTALLLVLQVGSVIIGKIIGYKQPLSSEVTLFVLMFFIAYCLKHIASIDDWSKRRTIIISAAIVLFIYIAELSLYWLRFKYPTIPFDSLISLCSDESSITNIVAGFALFILVKNIKMKYSKIINVISTSTFGILLLHDSNVFRNTFWKIVSADKWGGTQNTVQFIAIYLGIVLIIFVVLMLIDLIRKYLLERLLTRTTLFSKLCKWLNQFYGGSIKDGITQE